MAGFLYSSFPNRVMPPFQIFAYAYIANSCEHNFSYSLKGMILKPSRIVSHGTLLMNILIFLIGGLHYIRAFKAPVGGALE